MRRVYIGKFSHHVRERDVERFFRSEGKIREILMKDGFAFVEFEHTDDAETAVRHLDGRDLDGDRVHVEFAKGPPRGRDGTRGRGSMDASRGSSRNGAPRRDFSRNDRHDRDDDRGRGRVSGSGSGGAGGSGGGISYAEKYGPPRNTDHRIIVENLSGRVSWQDLKDLMRQAGEVTFADAHKRERNMGIVDFASVKDMKHAIDTFDDTEFHGRRIKVYEDKGRRSERGSGGSGDVRRDGGARRSGRSRSRSRSPRRCSNSRSRSRERPALSRSRSRSPIRRDRDQPSRSRSVSVSPSAKREPQRSRSKSRSRDSPPSEMKRQSRSRSISRSRSRSRSRSASPANSSQRRKSRSRSRSASSIRSHGSDANSNSNNNNNNNNSNKSAGGDFKRRDESRSRSRSRSVSRSLSPSSKKARLSTSPASQNSVHAED